MKILYCTPYDLSFGSGIARCSRYLHEYYLENNNIGHSLSIFPMDRSAYVENVSFIKRLYLGLKDYQIIVSNFKKEICKNNYDIIHIASSASISLLKDYYLIKYLKKKEIPSIIHFHFGRIPELLKKKNWEWKVIAKIAKLATKVIVIDKVSYDALHNIGLTNIEYLPNPLSPKVEKFVEENSFSRKENEILFVGHVIKTKGIFELVKVCSSISGIKLKVVGLYTEDIKNDLTKLAEVRDEGKWIEFTGNLTAEKVLENMLTCSVFVLPTYTEGFPNVILESMICACPIITTDVGAIPEMLDIYNNPNMYGICVKPKQIENLKKSIEEMLTNKEFALSCAQNAQKRVKELYSISIIWEQMCRIWDNI